MAKTIHLIRHAQSTFNAAWTEDGADPFHYDARLSPLGLAQVEQARARARELPCDVVITTPLTRALQTATGLFGGHARIEVECLHREWQEHSCDVGRSPRLLAREFPDLGFDHLDDPWWHHPDKDANGIVIEPLDSFHARVAEFPRWVAARPEAAIVVVGHGAFFSRLIGRVPANCEIVPWQPV
jgi:glucosyl-3-phosphoglycerate phosphatase